MHFKTLLTSLCLSTAFSTVIAGAIDFSKLTDIKKGICFTTPAACELNIVCRDVAPGPIRNKWESLGGVNGILGCSYEKEDTIFPGIGNKRRWIFWRSGSNVAYAIHGNIYKAFKIPVEQALGWPTTDYRPLIGGIGQFVRFEKGWIQDHPSSGINIVQRSSSGSGLKFQSEGGAPNFGRVLRVTYSGNMHITDHENFGKNQEAYHDIAPSPLNILPSYPSGTFTIVDRCAGDEVRVTLHATADRVSDEAIPEGAVTINLHAKLYEGTDCSTDDLETEQKFSFLLMPGQQVPKDIALRDSSGWADIHVVFSVALV